MPVPESKHPIYKKRVCVSELLLTVRIHLVDCSSTHLFLLNRKKVRFVGREARKKMNSDFIETIRVSESPGFACPSYTTRLTHTVTPC